jgi:dedicated sortase system histidine kinase
VKLRHQLFFVSLLLLSLPWAGCRYLQAVDVVLRESQAQTLLSIAKASADRFAADAVLFNGPFTESTDDALVLYAQSFLSPLLLDGYEDDWRNYNIASRQFVSANERMSVALKTAEFGSQFYFFIRVPDTYIQYYNPASNDLFAADHISIRLMDEQQSIYYLYSSAPGEMVARYRDTSGAIREQNGIKGVWREVAGGYQMELTIEKKLLLNGFTMDFVDYQPSLINQLRLIESVDSSASVKKIQMLAHSRQLQNLLANYSLPEFSSKILNTQRYLLASVDADVAELQSAQIPWLIEWFYRRALNSEHLSGDNRQGYSGVSGQIAMIDDTAMDAVVNGEQGNSGARLSWYRNESRRHVNSQWVARVDIPIVFKNKIVGYFLLEKTTDQLIALTSTAFNRMFIYTTSVIALIALSLMLYASWLSWRISRINRAIDVTVSDQGKLTFYSGTWPDSHAGDELGHLSRSYRKILLRLQEYNEYLRSLSNKLSHELRTPIAIVRSSLDNLAQVDTVDERQAYCQRAQQGIERLDAILNAMSAANRIEESLSQAEFVETHIDHFLQKMLTVYRDVYPSSTIEYISVSSENIHCMIAPDLFVQMLDKLVDNAVDFSPVDKPIIIRLQIRGQQWQLSVENSGPLLPLAMKDRLFESMVSLRNTAELSHKNHLGLGLYIVRLIVELHGGRVEADNSSNGQGVIFSIILPLNNNKRSLS